MKKFLIFIIIAASLVSLVSCQSEPSAYVMLSDFVGVYGAEGVIYSPEVEEGDDGYVTDELFSKIYIYDGEIPENFAVFLNAYSDYGSECAVFVCSDEAECSAIIEACRERASLLGRSDGGTLVMRSGYIVFYSTMADSDRAKSLWRKIIREYT